MTMIDRAHLAELRAREEQSFIDLHPASASRSAAANQHLLGGVPMAWMTRLPGSFPLFFDRAEGASITDVDSIRYVDFCLGDTGAMAGHAPVMTTIRDGEIRVYSDTTTVSQRIMVAGGFAEVGEHGLTVLAESATILG